MMVTMTTSETREAREIKRLIAEAEQAADVLGGPVLVGVAEIAVDQDVARQTVSMWAARRHSNGFPEPIITLSMGPVYNLSEVRAWRKTRSE